MTCYTDSRLIFYTYKTRMHSISVSTNDFKNSLKAISETMGSDIKYAFVLN